MKNKNILMLVLYIMFFIFTGCKEQKVIDVKLSNYETIQDIDDFKIDDLKLIVTYNDNTTKEVFVSEDMVSKEDLDKLNVIGMHDIKINYLDKVITLSINLTNYYEVTYILNGKIVDKQSVEHGMNITLPDKSITNKEGYTFLGWNHNGKNITEDTIIEGTYEINKYTVNIIVDGILFDTKQVEHGNDVTLPTVNDKYGYTFKGWNSDGKNITSDAIIEGTYEINKYMVQFLIDGKITDTKEVEHGKDVIFPILDEKYGYTFTGWNSDGKNITSDTIIEGTYEINKYTVNFLIDDEIIDTQIVEHGKDAYLPEPLEKEDYIMFSWKYEEGITENTNVYAKYELTEIGYLKKYKKKALKEINDSILIDQSMFENDEWKLITSYMENADKEIKILTNEKEIDEVVFNTKQLIENVASKYYKQKNEKMPGEEKFTEGNGTLNSPFIIDTKGKLIYFSNCINNGIGTKAYYELKADIDLRDIEWIPIGLEYSFEGYFNGKGYEISNFRITKIKDSSYNYGYSLFGENFGVIENLGINNILIDVKIEKESYNDNIIYFGGIVGYNDGIINNCYVLGDIKLEYHAGMNSTDFLKTNDIRVGGIATSNYNTLRSKITNCYAQINYSFYNTLWTNEMYNEINSYGIIDSCFSISKIERSYGEDTRDFVINYTLIKDEVYSNIDSTKLNTLNFYLNELGWDESIWDFSNIIFENDKYLENNYPKLKDKE